MRFNVMVKSRSNQCIWLTVESVTRSLGSIVWICEPHQITRATTIWWVEVFDDRGDMVCSSPQDADLRCEVGNTFNQSIRLENSYESLIDGGDGDQQPEAD